MLRLLGERGLEARAFPTVGPLSATALAGEAVAGGASIVVSYGGDGTANEVAQAVAGSDVGLAVWPGGTANVIAGELSMPSRTAELAQVIAAGKTRRIALGRAQAAEQSIDRYFIMMAGIGIDAEVSRTTSPLLKRMGGKLAFGVSAVWHLLAWPFAPFSLSVEGEHLETAFALVANGRGYGASICLAPDAKLEEPSFEVFAMPVQARRLAYLRAFVACRREDACRRKGRLIEARRLEASSAGEVWVQVDGEVAGRLPMSFEIVPDALSVVVP